MDIREKLVELMKEVKYSVFPNSTDHYTFGVQLPYSDHILRQVADHLIAHSVTVQERGSWKYYHKQNKAVCTNCSFERDLGANFGNAIACPNCCAKMDGGNEDA